jgi:ubiquitin carboxyl-terminal hydrolase 34
VFPLGEPFKCLYTIHALREYLSTRRLRSLAIRAQGTEGESRDIPGEKEPLLKTMSLVVAAIEDPNVIGGCPTESLQRELSFRLLDTFVQLLTGMFPMKILSLGTSHKAPGSEDLPMIDDFLTRSLHERLTALLSEASAADHSQYAVEVTNRALRALLECCSLSKNFWERFCKSSLNKKLIEALLLGDDRAVVRKGTAQLIRDKCSFTQTRSSTTALQFSEKFWSLLFDLLPKAVHQPVRSEEVFTLLLFLMDILFRANSPELSVETCLKLYIELALIHTSTESLTSPDGVDFVAHGLLRLLYYGVKHFSERESIQFPPNLGRKLFYKHLFPRLDYDEVRTQVLLTHGNRKLVYEILSLLMRNSRDQQRQMLYCLSSIVPYHTDYDGSPYFYDLPQGFDRMRAIKTPGVHAGLRNLSNTCYLNSLFTQLFMNVHFRRFILQVPSKGRSHPNLLNSTQTLFAELQDSLRRSIDPAHCVALINNYEETPIDIHTQMDVDEFFNLLFDRWESVMPNARTKSDLRSIYGGQLVQQVKSKECEHISERIEPFSAIQCDIKGISSLQESLQAYVDGEPMEGDNKYKCELCNKHVDAVKRACLKEIPDHLIFHLKRFSFDLRTLQRNKINDHFEFPTEIDMSPFTVEHLSDSCGEITPDVFELVGVLVHAGTAESGHYYSYIRERPTSDGTQPWFEFNDDTVSPWDPANLSNSCFGGRDPSARFDGGLGFEKGYSAYMLFYQRSSTLKRDHEDLRISGHNHPVRVEPPVWLAANIADENSMIVHRYVSNDHATINFAQMVLDRVWDNPCSRDHTTEDTAMKVALGHLDQIAARAQDIPDFLPLFSRIRQACEKCPRCCLSFFYFFKERIEALRMLLVKNTAAIVRQSISELFKYVLKTVKDAFPEQYNPLPQDSDIGDEDLTIVEPPEPSVLTDTVEIFNTLWESFHTSLRAWPEFFGALAEFASFSKVEGAALLEEYFLTRLFFIIIADITEPELSPQYARLAQTLYKRPRAPNYEAIISLIDTLMGYLEGDLANQEILESAYGRFQLALNDEPLPYTAEEVNLLHRQIANTHTVNSLFVDKLVLLNQNPVSTESILRKLIKLGTEMEKKVFATTAEGLSSWQTDPQTTPLYLQSVAFYLRWTHSQEHAHSLIKFISERVEMIAPTTDGMAFSNFYRMISEVPRPEGEDVTFVQRFALEFMHLWAPPLLGFADPSVRLETDLLVKQMLWTWLDNHRDRSTEGDIDAEVASHVKWCKMFTVASLEYLYSKYVSSSLQAPRGAVSTLLEHIERGEEYFMPAYHGIAPRCDMEYERTKRGMSL